MRLIPVELGQTRKSASRHLNDSACCVCCGSDAIFDAAATDELTEEPVDEGASSPVRIDELLFGGFADAVLDELSVV